jgi:hypothetical protein
MYFVTDLSEPAASGNMGILGIVDRWRKLAIYLPCRMDID